jgi:hypothetical protein
MTAAQASTENAESTSSAVRIRPNLIGYATAKSASGSSTKICGDAVSVALVGATLDETYVFVASVVGIGEDVLREKYSKANLGQQRMFLGNLIRGALGGKDKEKAARVEAAFEAGLPAFREGVNTRLEAEAAETAANKQALADEREAKAKAKADEKAAAKAEAQAKKDAEKATAAAKAK